MVGTHVVVAGAVGAYLGLTTLRDRVVHQRVIAGSAGCAAYLDQMCTPLEVVAATAELEERPEMSALLDRFRDWKRDRSPDPA